MEFHMINITYAALHVHAETEKKTFSCKDDCTLTKHTALDIFRSSGHNIGRNRAGILA